MWSQKDSEALTVKATPSPHPGVGGQGEKFGLYPSKPISTQIYGVDLAFKM